MQRNARKKQGRKSAAPRENTVAGPYNIPSIPLNPKRRYTVVFTNADETHPGSAGFTFAALALQVDKQLGVQVHGEIPPVGTGTVTYKNIRVIKARAWGVIGKPMELVPAQLGGLPIPPTRFDQSAGSSDRPYAEIKLPNTAWATTATNTTVFSVVQAHVVHALVEVW
jgi:hypothetical protein